MVEPVKKGESALLADIGGTHARFSTLGPRRDPTEPLVLRTAGYADFAAALDDYRRQAGVSESFAKAAIGVAGPVIDGTARLTNCDWDLSSRAIGEAIGGGQTVLVNDFTAIALSLTALGRRDVRKLGSGDAVADAARAVLGPGTGLGVSGLVPHGRGQFAAIAGEGGHVGLSAADAREMEVLARLRDRFEHVSAERVLSGPGLGNLYRALAELAGLRETEAPRPDEISRLARTRESPVAMETVALFTRWLGAVAGDLALTLGARGGVYLAGGIVNRWGSDFDTAVFRQGFEAKGRFRDYMACIPTWVITAEHPAFKGLATLV